MRVELKDSLEFLYPDSIIGSKPCRQTVLDVTRWGIVSVHVLINGLRKGDKVKIAVKSAGRKIKYAKWFRLIDVPVEANTGPIGSTEKEKERNRFVTRHAPFRVFDAMEPIKSSFQATGSTTALRLHLPIPKSAKAGKQNYAIEISCDDEKYMLEIDVNIHAVAIAPAGRDSFPYTNWFSLSQMASRHGLKQWSDAHFKMIRKYADLMHYARQNTFMIPLREVFDVNGGKSVLNRERLRRIVKTFTDAGLYYIEGGHLGGRPNGDWKSTRIELALTGRLATSAEGNRDLSNITRQLMEEIERNGWRGRWIQHIADEPWHPNATDYRVLSGMVRKYMKGIPIIDATMDTSIVGSVDIWCPQAQKYQKHRRQFDSQRISGDKVWFYTCCFPGGPWLNRLLDMELIRPALFGWTAALFQLDGFLHWGFNNYVAGQNPFKKSVTNPSGTFSLPAGDTHIAYPGKNGPWSSVRLEAQREGFEDYELLRILRQKHPKKADIIIRRIIRGFNDYTKNLKILRKAHKALLRVL